MSEPNMFDPTPELPDDTLISDVEFPSRIREVACGFTGTYSDGEAEVDGTALVGKTSVSFHAKLTLQSPL